MHNDFLSIGYLITHFSNVNTPLKTSLEFACAMEQTTGWDLSWGHTEELEAALCVCPVYSLIFASCLHIPVLSLSRCSPTERLCIARTCWMTAAAWPCWLWAFCCSPLCWSWLWLPTVAWPDTSSWACVSFPTAAPSTRTCPPHANGGLVQEAAVASGEAQRGRGRVVCGCRAGEERRIVYGYIMYSSLMIRVGLFESRFFFSKANFCRISFF